MKAVLSPNYAKLKNVPKVTNETEAANMLNSIIPFAFYLRVDKGQTLQGTGHPKMLSLNPMQMFRPEDLYAWFYEGPMWTTYLGGLAMVAVLLAGVMFPLWPPTLRLGVWYLSIGVLGLIGLFIVIAILRLIFYLITVVVAPPGIWVFPKLFADVGVVSLLHLFRLYERKLIISFCFFVSPPRSNRSFRSGSGTCRKRRNRASIVRRSLRRKRGKGKRSLQTRPRARQVFKLRMENVVRTSRK